MTIDLLTYWPMNLDYPYYRALIGKHGPLFDNQYAIFSEHHVKPVIQPFTESELSKLGFTIIPSPPPNYVNKDWFHTIIMMMLEKSTADVFWIMHPDFLVKDFKKLFYAVRQALEDGADLVGFTHGLKQVLIEPALFVMKRESFNKTSQDVSFHDGYDHCTYITIEANDMGMKVLPLQELGFKENKDFYHVGGVSQVFHQGLLEEYVINEKDYIYLHWALRAPFPLHSLYVERMEKLLNKFQKVFLDTDTEKHWLTEFLDYDSII